MRPRDRHPTPRRRRFLRALALVAAAALGAAGAAHLRAAAAGGVAARVAIPEDFAYGAAPLTPRGAYRTIPLYQLDIDAPSYAPASEMVAVLVGKGDLPEPAPLLLSIRGGQLSPAVSVVPKGTKLTVRNESLYDHHILADAAGFDAGVLPKDKTSAEIVLAKPGMVLFHDVLWPHVSARILVLDEALVLPVTATPGPPSVADIKFVGVSAGPHEFRLYFRGEVVHRAPVDVAEGAADVKVAVTLTPYVPPPPESTPALAPASEPGTDHAPKEKGDKSDKPDESDKPDKSDKADEDEG